MIETALLMDDAREIGRSCAAGTKRTRRRGSSSLASFTGRYSSRCCIDDVDLELVDAEAKT